MFDNKSERNEIVPFRSYHVKVTLRLVSNFKTMQYNSSVSFLSTVSVCAVYHFI